MTTDIAAHRHFHLLSALLDHVTPPWRPGEMPPLGHWLMFPPDTRQSMLGFDGHPARSDDGLPRRMWAGSRLRFLTPVPLGATVTRETQVTGETAKQGRSGAMLFVTLLHRLSVDGVVAIEEEQDIVYREAAAPGASVRLPAPDVVAPAPAVARTVRAGQVICSVSRR